MKNYKLKLLSIALLSIGATSANAQWAVTNVNDATNQLIWKAGSSAISNQVAGVNTATQTMMINMQKNLQTTDKANRGATFQAEAIKYMKSTAPTLQQCINRTESSGKAGAIAAAAGGGGSPYSPEATTTKAPESETKIAENVLKNKATLGTCTAQDINTGGCTATTASPYQAGDYHPRGMDGDIQNIPVNSKGPLYNSYTLNSKGNDVAQQNIYNQTSYGQPRSLTPDENAKNPQYNLTATVVNSKLNVAKEALQSLTRMKQPSAAPLQGTAAKFWNNGANFTTVTGLKGPAPKNPSLYDVVNYSVMDAFAGSSTAPTDITELNKRVALNNFIMWKIYQQNEQMIRLQANQLVQSVTPAQLPKGYYNPK